MGILTTILSRVGIPLAIAVIAGIVISTFREQIIGGITAGASTIGQAITTPFGAILQGFNQGFGAIPEFIDFRLPEFRFLGFGATGGTPPPLTPPPAGTVPFMGGTITTPAGCTIDPQGRISCPTPPIFTPPTGTPPPPQVQGSPPPNPFTLFQGASQRIAVTLPSGFSGIRTRGEIVEQFPDVIGLFDLLSTTKTEFLPLSAQQVQEQQADLKLSAQIFEEVKNKQEALSFA